MIPVVIKKIIYQNNLKYLIQYYKKRQFKIISNNEILYYDKLSYILAYEVIDMTTNKISRKQILLKNNKDKTFRTKLHKQNYEEFNKIKKDLIIFGELISDIKYHDWIKEQRIKLFPNKIKFNNDNIYYHLKSNLQDFLVSIFYISNELEKINNIKIRLFNVFPLNNLQRKIFGC